ncbi:hypothetical protein GDO86_004651 [Hymenochirus boettgeri]|nr:hypothetical protein GDO86_004651 [Hymenochirus boettgeri]
MAAAVKFLGISRCLAVASRLRFPAARTVLIPPISRRESWQSRCFSSEEKVTVKFINRDGETLVAEGNVGESLLDVVVGKNLDIDGFGACEGTLACSTCHLIFEDHTFQQLDPITDEEMDMLDLAFGLTDT